MDGLGLKDRDNFPIFEACNRSPVDENNVIFILKSFNDFIAKNFSYREE